MGSSFEDFSRSHAPAWECLPQGFPRRSMGTRHICKTSAFARIKTQIVLVSVLLLIAGCAGRQEFKKIDVSEADMQSYLADKPEKLRP